METTVPCHHFVNNFSLDTGVNDLRCKAGLCNAGYVLGLNKLDRKPITNRCLKSTSHHCYFMTVWCVATAVLWNHKPESWSVVGTAVCITSVYPRPKFARAPPGCQPPARPVQASAHGLLLHLPFISLAPNTWGRFLSLISLKAWHFIPLFPFPVVNTNLSFPEKWLDVKLSLWCSVAASAAPVPTSFWLFDR